MKKVIVYGSPMCPHCVEAKEILDKEGIRYGYVDITAGMAHLKKFLALRDSRPEFDKAKAVGDIGIPCFLVDDKDLYVMLPENLDVFSIREGVPNHFTGNQKAPTQCRVGAFFAERTRESPHCDFS